jgi:hypothetical protein
VYDKKKNQHAPKGEQTKATTVNKAGPVRSGTGLTMRKRMNQAVRPAGHPDDGRTKEEKAWMSSLDSTRSNALGLLRSLEDLTSNLVNRSPNKGSHVCMTRGCLPRRTSHRYVRTYVQAGSTTLRYTT